ncbi:dephospho-kinase cab5 [Pyrenophora seminiperda CCB06]|uniref:Dephospho-kinase cab5 n=1 Tax=Pyrenophora seminiperda CCB06 TaxID=1302712 RepID=A0A3M7M0D0_9PLEO|nr:dephospho-kinase cab5 [Pyrenophora seminiperda CCB06]
MNVWGSPYLKHVGDRLLDRQYVSLPDHVLFIPLNCYQWHNDDPDYDSSLTYAPIFLVALPRERSRIGYGYANGSDARCEKGPA